MNHTKHLVGIMNSTTVDGRRLKELNTNRAPFVVLSHENSQMIPIGRVGMVGVDGNGGIWATQVVMNREVDWDDYYLSMAMRQVEYGPLSAMRCHLIGFHLLPFERFPWDAKALKRLLEK